MHTTVKSGFALGVALFSYLFPLTAAAQEVVTNDTTGVELEEMVVTQRRRLTQSDGAKLTYNVSEDPESNTSNILDILRKVPGVTVDAEENVKVNGQSSFKILMNNREDPMLDGDIKTALKSIPASSIKKIEVISEPGAKYEAEGTGGILNFVTNTSRNLDGFTTRLNTWINKSGVGLNADGRVKLRNVMLGANASYFSSDLWSTPLYANNTTEDLTGSSNHLKEIGSRITSHSNMASVNLNASWEPDTLNLFTINASFFNYARRTTSLQTTAMYDPDMSPLWTMERDGYSRNKSLGGGFGASYQRTFGRSDNTLVLSYLLQLSNSHNTTRYDLESHTGPAMYEAPSIEQRENAPGVTHVVQIDYANQFNSRHKLETGVKLNIDHPGMHNTFLTGNSPDELASSPDSEVKFTQFKDIYALYGAYSGTFAKWSVAAGLRYEFTRMGMDYKIGTYPDFTTHLHDLVPNAAVSYNITDASALRAAYQMRISRPGIGTVNPFRNELTPGNVQYGNPDLRSEKIHMVSLTYTNYDHPLSGSAKLYYRYTGNGITDILFMRDDVLNSTYANVGRTQDVGIEINAGWSITKDLTWSLFYAQSYEHIEANSEMLKAKNKGWSSNVNTDISYTLPCKLRLSGYYGMYSGWIDAQSKGKGTYWYGIGASRSWLKDDALTVSVSLANLLPEYRTNSYTQKSESVIYRNSTRYSQWHAGVSLSFRFGKLRSEVKRTAAQVETEQSATGGNK